MRRKFGHANIGNFLEKRYFFCRNRTIPKTGCEKCDGKAKKIVPVFLGTRDKYVMVWM